MNRRRLLRLKRAGLLGPRGSKLSTAVGAEPVQPLQSVPGSRSTGDFGTLAVVLAGVFVAVMLWAMLDQDVSNPSGPEHTGATFIEPVPNMPLTSAKANVSAGLPTLQPHVVHEPRAHATVDVDALMLGLTQSIAKGSVRRDGKIMGYVQSLGTIWLALSQDDRMLAAQRMVDAIVLCRDAPATLRAVVAAMSTPMRDDVFAMLELRSDVAPLPAALLVSP